MDLNKYVKKISFPTDFKPPVKLSYKDLVASPLNRSDLQDDLESVNSSLELIRDTRGGTWPSETITEEFNFLDLAWHEREFRDGDSFAYVVRNNQDEYIGCFYLYPMGLRTELNNDNIDFDIDASWWVCSRAYKQGYYEKLYNALKQWLDEFPVSKVYYSNKQIPSYD